MNKNLLRVTAAVAVAIAVLAAYLFLTRESALHGSVIEPRSPAAAIRLTDFNGHPFTLSGVRGSVGIIYFGYTNCPNECPLTMANLTVVQEDLGAQAEHAKVIFITTDPERDTDEALRDFLGKFSTDFIGLAGDTGRLAQVWRDYGVTVLDGGETHSNYLYLIDTLGNLVETLPSDAAPADIAADVRILMREN